MITGLYGLNVAVKDFEKAIKRFEEILGVKPKYFRKEDFAFANLVGAQFFLGEIAITVVGSETEDTAIAKFVKDKGEGVFLVSLLVDDIEESVKEMKGKGVNFVVDIKDVPLGKVTFAHPKSLHGVQMEILQLKK